MYNLHLCCVLSCSRKYLNVFLLKDPIVRPSTRNSLGNSLQSFAPVNLKVRPANSGFYLFLSDFEGGLRFWVLGLRSSFSTHPRCYKLNPLPIATGPLNSLRVFHSSARF